MSPARLACLLAASLLAACSSNPVTSNPMPDAGQPSGSGGGGGSGGSGGKDAGPGVDAGPPLPWSASAIGHLPEDDTLRVTDLQAKGTHNSYHVEMPGNTEAEWDYTMAPLDVQLGQQGVRQLELDLNLASLADDFEIYHFKILDQGTNCLTLRDCLTTIGEWSGAHPDHQVLYIQLEPKDGFTPDDPEAYFSKLEGEILSVLVRERIVTPDEVQGTAATLGEAVSTVGWPTLGQTRGRIIFAFDDTEMVRDAYSHSGTSLKNRLIFTNQAAGDPLAAVAILNDAVPQAAQIQAALAAHMIVRDTADDPADDDATAQAGLVASLAVGAQWVSTNYPAQVPERSYFEVMPGGSPSRCNPVTAPPGCLAADIEALAP